MRDIVAELRAYLERKLLYAQEDLKLGIMPGIQDSIELERLTGKIEEIEAQLAFIRYHLQCQSRAEDFLQAPREEV
jgi:hypothetical protein